MVQYFKNLWIMFTQASISQLTFLDLLVITVILVVAGFIAFKLAKAIYICVKHIFKCLFKEKSAKSKCSKITCPYCGRTLDQCTCERNKGKSCSHKLHQYKKEQKAKKVAKKEKVKLTLVHTKTAKVEKTKNDAVVAKKKADTKDVDAAQTIVSDKAARYIEK